MTRTFNGLGAFAAHLETLIRTAPLAERQAMDEASQEFLETVRDIPGEYQPGWSQLADATKQDRTRRGFTPNDPLLRTGELRDSYERKVVDHRHAEVGSNDERAPMFENGTKKMPPRPVLGAAMTRDEKRVPKAIGRRVYRHLIGK